MHQVSVSNEVMADESGCGPRQLKLVTLPTHLGDLSGMSAHERAELVEQDGRRRIMDEMCQVEADRLRQFFWTGGIHCGGFCAAVGSSLLLDTVLYRSYGTFDGLVTPLEIVGALGGVAAVICFFPALWFGVKWIGAMRHRRTYLKSGQLIRK